MASNSSYYIYIKNVKQENKKTTPKAPSDYGGDSDKGNGGTKPTPPNEGGGKRVPSFVPYSSQMNAVGRLFSSGVSAFAKASISIAILTKTLQIAEQTTTAINNYVSVQTGDYSSKLKRWYLFPPYDYMVEYYPFLQKHKYMLPAMWMVRGFNGVFLHRGRKKVDMLKNIDNESIERITNIYRNMNLRFRK